MVQVVYRQKTAYKTFCNCDKTAFTGSVTAASIYGGVNKAIWLEICN